MKRKSFIYLILVLLSITNNYANAQYSQSNKEAIRMLKEFYTSYITQFAIGDADEKEFRSIQRKYCTTKLLHNLPKLIEQHDEDPLIKAQDSDTAYLKTLSIKKVSKRDNIYSVSYGNPSDKVTIHLRVVKENGSFKIDSVW